MTPQKQLILHDPEKGINGDCQRAVIASLMDLPIAEVPHFNESGDATEFWELLQGFCNSRGYHYIEMKAASFFAWGSDLDIYHEISGPSPRFPGAFHAVVGKNGQIFFDPHPDGTGLAGDPSEWKFTFLVPISKLVKVRNLNCTCCGARHRGRQFHNMDIGYGLCPSCGPRCKAVYSQEEFERTYGKEGFNFAIPGEQDD